MLIWCCIHYFSHKNRNRTKHTSYARIILVSTASTIRLSFTILRTDASHVPPQFITKTYSSLSMHMFACA